MEGLAPIMVTCSDAIVELEDSKVPVTVKYLIASRILGAAFARDSAPLQDFATLIQLRNAIMHAKPATNDSSHQGTRITDVLAQRGIATRLEPGVQFAWFNRLPVSLDGLAPLRIPSFSGLSTSCRPDHRMSGIRSSGSKEQPRGIRGAELAGTIQ